MSLCTKGLLTLSLLTILCSSSLAQDSDPINTDRPTNAVSAYLVSKGRLQIESGFRYTNYKGQLIDPFIPGGNTLSPIDFQTFLFNELGLRYGLSDALELRLTQFVGKSRIKFPSATANGEVEFMPTLIGLKVHLANESNSFSQISLSADIGGPIFSEFETGTVGDIRVNFSNGITPKLRVDYNIGLNMTDGLSNGAFSYAMVLGYLVNPKVTLFAELNGLVPKETRKIHVFDFGLMYLVNPNLQLDVFAGTGVTENALDAMFGFGFSTRIPQK